MLHGVRRLLLARTPALLLPLASRTMTTFTVDSPEFQAIQCPELSTLANLFNKHGFELRLAGGAVRDLLSGKSPADLDFATTATPDQMKEMFTQENIRMINALGEKHGTITARINDTVNFEVTTLRIDKVTDGRRAEVEFTKDWQLDANRRDLTINSMFLGLDGTVYDYFDGHADLKNRKVRFVGDPVQRIQEDYLRILRYFRFYGRIAVSPDEHDFDTIQAIRDNVAGLKIVSGERIWTEVKKTLAGNYAGELFLTMLAVGIGPFIGLPESPDTEEFLKVWNRCKEQKIRLESQTLLAALLRSEEEVMDVHARLRLSGVERDTCLFVVANRGDLPHPVPIRPYQWLYVDSKAKDRDTVLFITELLKYRGDTHLAEEFSQWIPPKFPVTGHHLQENGVPKGKTFAVVLQKLKDAWKTSDFQLTEAELVGRIPTVLDTLSQEDLSPPRSKKAKKSRLKF